MAVTAAHIGHMGAGRELLGHSRQRRQPLFDRLPL